MPARGNATSAAFGEALWRCRPEIVAALARQVDPNAPDRWQRTPMMMAAEWGDAALVSLLLARGAMVDQQRRHLTPLTVAARRGADDIVRVLREAGAQPSIVTWFYLGDRARIEQALRRDPDSVRLRDEAGTPLLHHAAAALRPALVRLLLDRGAAVTDTDEGGEAALHRIANLRMAPPAETTAIARLLLDRGADPNARNWSDVTPLHDAVRARNVAVVKLLLERGADPNARDKRGVPVRASARAAEVEEVAQRDGRGIDRARGGGQRDQATGEEEPERRSIRRI